MNAHSEELELMFVPKAEDEVLKYRVFPQNGRFVIGRMVAGTMGTMFDAIDDCRTEAFANARCAALNRGEVK